jgi:hypothetical protein
VRPEPRQAQRATDPRASARLAVDPRGDRALHDRDSAQPVAATGGLVAESATSRSVAVTAAGAARVVGAGGGRLDRYRTHWRPGTWGMTWSTRCAAVCSLRRAPHDGRKLRRLQLQATSLSRPQSPQRNLRKPCARMAHSRNASNSSLTPHRTCAWRNPANALLLGISRGTGQPTPRERAIAGSPGAGAGGEAQGRCIRCSAIACHISGPSTSFASLSAWGCDDCLTMTTSATASM